MLTKKQKTAATGHKPASIQLTAVKDAAGTFGARFANVKLQEKADSMFPGPVVTITYELEDGRKYYRDYKPELIPGGQLFQVVKTILGLEEGSIDVADLYNRECQVVVEKRTTRDGAKDYYTVSRVLPPLEQDEDESEEDEDETPGYASPDDEEDDAAPGGDQRQGLPEQPSPVKKVKRSYPARKGA